MRALNIILLLLVSLSLQAQLMRPSHYSLAAADSVYSGLIGGSISDIVGRGDTVWLGTNYGLSASFDNGDSFVGYSNRFSDISRGGISALEVSGDTIWIATGYDSTTFQGDLKTGGGISRSTDGGASWTWLGQPQDSLQMIVVGNDTTYGTYSDIIVWGDTLLAVDVVTPIQNITYDLAYDGKRLWATSFGGGLRVSHDLGDHWERVMLPWDGQNRLDSLVMQELKSTIKNNPEQYALDPILHLNHVLFSVKAWNDTIWVGTAGGINHSTDGGLSWDHYTFQNSNISGNWVIALHRQILADGNERIWASTVTTGSGDATGLSFYDVAAETWRATLIGQKAWNIASDASSVYAATDDGLWKSRDGVHFVLFPPFQNDDQSEIIYSDAVHAVMVNHDGAVWVGTGDGLAVSYNGGLSWNIHKSRSASSDSKFIAYPNPFTPRYDKVLNGQGHLIIRLEADAGDDISISVFDFTMHRVKEIQSNVPAPISGLQERTWNGRNEQGYLVANGTYFIRIEVASDTHWVKVMVIN